MDKNVLATLVNELGGYDQVESLLGVDSEILQRAIEGESLSRSENAEINKGFADAEINDTFSDYGLDINDIEQRAETLETAERFIDDQENFDVVRSAVADGLIDIDELQGGLGVFANLTRTQADQVIDYLAEGNSLTAMFEAYALDDNFWDIENSEFWAWFRDTFYSD